MELSYAYIKCTCLGRGGKTTINRSYYFSNEYLKTVKYEPIESCVNNIQIRNNKSSEKVQIRYS